MSSADDVVSANSASTVNAVFTLLEGIDLNFCSGLADLLPHSLSGLRGDQLAIGHCCNAFCQPEGHQHLS